MEVPVEGTYVQNEMEETTKMVFMVMLHSFSWVCGDGEYGDEGNAWTWSHREGALMVSLRVLQCFSIYFESEIGSYKSSIHLRGDLCHYILRWYCFALLWCSSYNQKHSQELLPRAFCSYVSGRDCFTQHLYAKHFPKNLTSSNST